MPATVQRLDWDQPYQTSKSLVIQVTAEGQLVANNSVSRTPQTLSPHLFVVLSGFLHGTTPRAALARLCEEEWEVEEPEFEAVVHRMVRLNFLTPLPAAGATNGAAAAALADRGFASVWAHHGMLRDVQRVMAYRAAIFRHAPGQRVLEIGCGTGILSIFAAQAGARSVVAVEESQIADVAARMFAANGLAEPIDLRRGNSRDLHLDEPADLIVHELIGVDPFGENMLVYLDDARRRLLRPGGRLLPGRFEVCCVGFEAEDPGARLREAAEFAGLYGVDFGPFLDALAAAEPPAPSHRAPSTTPLRPLTEETCLYDLDLASDALTDLPETPTHLQANRQGLLGGVDVFFRAHFDATTQLTNAPFVGSTHWHRRRIPFARPLPVEAGTAVRIVARLGTHLGKQRLAVEAG